MAWKPFSRIRRWWQFLKAVKQVANQLDGFLQSAETAMNTINVEADIWETGNNIIVQMEIPNIKKKNIKVEPMDTGIVVNVKQDKVNFSKYIPLPNYAETKKPKFSYENNILEIKIPKNKLAIK